MLDCLLAGSADFLKSMLVDQKTTSSCLYDFVRIMTVTVSCSVLDTGFFSLFIYYFTLDRARLAVSIPG